jgi:REP element-mobilizing transposase RayT
MRPVRWLAPGSVWLVTNRCEREMHLLRPDRDTTELIGGWFARALEKHGSGIQLYACVFLSNHFHLLLRDTKGQLSKVMWYFQTNLAKEINALRGRAPARVFRPRYHAQRIDDDRAFLASYRYVLCNPVKSGLVRRAAQWPGLTSLPAALGQEEQMEFELLDRTAFHNATRGGKQVRREDFMRTHVLRFAVPPMLEHLGPKRQAATEELVGAFEKEQQRLRAASGERFLGVRGVLAQAPESRPADPAFGPRRYVAASTREAEREALAVWRAVTEDYRERFRGFRRASLLGRPFHGEWPPWTCPPGCHEPVGRGAR